ncbi:hypothetical protein SUGI_0693760 [Cryptomeria japonica]|nr:hypothetical protein SUGI_0693760 [Cryptomeria japonica]
MRELEIESLDYRQLRLHLSFFHFLTVCRLTTTEVKRQLRKKRDSYCIQIVYRHHRAKPIIINPGFYMSKKTDIFSVIERRDSYCIPIMYRQLRLHLSFFCFLYTNNRSSKELIVLHVD